MSKFCADDACPCDKLPLVYPDVSNGVATAVGTTGACNLQDDASLNYSLQSDFLYLFLVFCFFEEHDGYSSYRLGTTAPSSTMC